MRKAISFCLLIAIAFAACKKEVGVAGPAGPQGNNGPDGVNHDTASISGSLSLFSALSWPVPDSSGVTVTLKSGALQRTTTTDASGHYVFYGMEKGTYDLSYQKTGFGTMKVFGVSHSPGGPLSTVVPEIYLLQQPSATAVLSLTGSESSPPYIQIHVSLDTTSVEYTPYYGNLVVLFGKTPDVSLSNYMIMHSEYVNPDGAGGYIDILDKSALSGIFNPGDSIYISACTYTRYVHKLKDPNAWFDLGSAAYYIDPETGNYVYPNLSSSPNVLRFAY